MAKHKEQPRYHILSVRVSEEEREILNKLSLETDKNVSDLMREALEIMLPWPASH
jgi:predicted DNA-binding protein